MTSKRFHKLYYSEMAKLMRGNKKAGQVLKAVRKCRPLFNAERPGYQDMWEMLRPMFVQLPYNRGVKIPER